MPHNVSHMELMIPIANQSRSSTCFKYFFCIIHSVYPEIVFSFLYVCIYLHIWKIKWKFLKRQKSTTNQADFQLKTQPKEAKGKQFFFSFRLVWILSAGWLVFILLLFVGLCEKRKKFLLLRQKRRKNW